MAARSGLRPGRHRDERGRRAVLSIYPTETGLVVVLPDDRVLSFTRLEAGHLRGALRVAVFRADPPPGIDVGRLAAEVSWRGAA